MVSRLTTIVPTSCFVNESGISNRTNIVSLEIIPPMDQTPPDTIYSGHQFVNMGQNSLGTTCYNSPLT
ncbi:3263_t:CDS:2 [Diversispora eburnea]|uniref:3263_t:CDS:1 n=1 Tax=Diversispora eburnea TaxID=1213867 RepID=A0A9N9C8R3_9GLOM|nr:3263_t:CDS:2 [Diversispora eburnea]